MVFVLIFSALVLGAAAGFGAYFLIRWFGVKKFSDSLQISLFLISVPRISPDDKNRGEAKDFKSEIAHFEELLGRLVGLQKAIRVRNRRAACRRRDTFLSCRAEAHGGGRDETGPGSMERRERGTSPR